MNNKIFCIFNFLCKSESTNIGTCFSYDIIIYKNKRINSKFESEMKYYEFKENRKFY